MKPHELHRLKRHWDHWCFVYFWYAVWVVCVLGWGGFKAMDDDNFTGHHIVHHMLWMRYTLIALAPGVAFLCLLALNFLVLGIRQYYERVVSEARERR